MATIKINYVASAIGQIIISTDGLTFTVELPLVSDEGWLTNNLGQLLVQG